MNDETNQSGQTDSVAGSLLGPRVKEDRRPWDQLPIEAKIERIRYTLRVHMRAAVNRGNSLRERVEALEHHEHSKRGAVVVDIHSRRRGYAELGQSFDPLA